MSAFSSFVSNGTFTIEHVEPVTEGIKVDLAVECLKTYGALRLRVAGTSMLPSMGPGSLVLICQTAPSTLRPGDIPLVRTGNRFRLHRLVRIEEQSRKRTMITRGDNHSRDDPAFSESEILGKLVSVRRPPPRVFSRLLQAWGQH
jgi:signal peptidase I